MFNYCKNLTAAIFQLFSTLQTLAKSIINYRAFAYWLDLRAAIFQVLLNIDLVGNAICYGNRKVTISARVHFISHYRKCYWFNAVEWCIDTAFLHIDRPLHCYWAYESQKNKTMNQGPTWALVLLSILSVLGSAVIGIVAWFCYGIKCSIDYLKQHKRLMMFLLLLLSISVSLMTLYSIYTGDLIIGLGDGYLLDLISIIVTLLLCFFLILPSFIALIIFIMLFIAKY